MSIFLGNMEGYFFGVNDEMNFVSEIGRKTLFSKKEKKKEKLNMYEIYFILGCNIN